jgi:hypothetical protein
MSSDSVPTPQPAAEPIRQMCRDGFHIPTRRGDDPGPVVVRWIGDEWQKNRRVVMRHICAYCRQTYEREEPVGRGYGPLGCPYYDL